ncbi:hypothetical protein LUZ60_010882 [Juncus effusus]|nr:hypothetical protein LUZ60_010882 [Juncus effusus]
MAEVCCEGAEIPASTTATLCESTPITVPRRRLEIRRLRLVEETGSNGSEADPPSTKRRRILNSGDNGSCCAVESESKPDNPNHESVRAEQCPRYGMTSVCGRRREMEDAVSIRPDFVQNRHFFGVFDGHGCSHVANACHERMHDLVSEEFSTLQPTDQLTSDKWTAVMKQSFNRMDGEAASWTAGSRTPACTGRPTRCEHAGSTAVVAVVGPMNIVVSNCGDSRAVLSRNGVAIPLSSDHKPDRPDELERIQAAGGRVIYWDGPRVLGVLAMSRAIGDGYLKPYVISEPEVTITERQETDECLILASDGLWDVVTNEMACDVVRMCLNSNGPASDKACNDAALLLTKLALARRSADNVSVVVVDLRRNV